MRYVVQRRTAQRYLELFEMAAQFGPFEEFKCAVAYATVGGVCLLEETLKSQLDDTWVQMRKRWLVGIDWCRSDPPAFRRLEGMKKSQVRVPNGGALVKTDGCTPRDTFHPKLFVFAAPSVYAVICGSGNLSANGLSRGCEVGSLVVANRTSRKDTSDVEEVEELLRWLEQEWRRADRYDALADDYESICRERIKKRNFVPTDDDNRPPEESGRSSRAALTEQQIRQLRTFDRFWIDAGALGANLGRGRPGNQLDMKRFTRAYFGASVDKVEPNTEIAKITLIWDGERHVDRTLKFGDNQMDKLNVPPGGRRGELFYDGKTLLFSRRPDGAFDFAAGDRTQRRVWRQSSGRDGIIHRLSSKREWGLF